MSERAIVVACVVQFVVCVVLAGLFVATSGAEALILGGALGGAAVAAFTLGRIHGARPWREFLAYAISVGAATVTPRERRP